MSAGRKGIRISQEAVAKIIAKNTGKKRTEETKKRLSEARRRWWKNKKEQLSPPT